MYTWIWRHLPFGLPGRIIGSVALAAAVVALLWYVIFPKAEPLLPFDDVQVEQEGPVPGPAGPAAPGGPGGAPGVGPGGSPEATPGENDIPYSTDENDQAPSTPPVR